MVYGILYFVFIFLDRVAYMISGRDSLFIGDSINGYTIGSGYATIFLLLSTGSSEISLKGISEFMACTRGAAGSGRNVSSPEAKNRRKKQSLHERVIRLLQPWL